MVLGGEPPERPHVGERAGHHDAVLHDYEVMRLTPWRLARDALRHHGTQRSAGPGWLRAPRSACSVGIGTLVQNQSPGAPVRSPARSEDVLACPAAPRFSMHRPARLGPRDAPLPVVHLATHGSKIAIARPVDIAVIRHAAQEIPLGRARLSGSAEKLLLLVRACLPKRLRAYPRPNEPVLEPTLVVGVVAPGRRLCQLAAPAIDPTIAIFVRPAAAMLGLVVGSATYRRLRLAHLRRIDPLLQHPAALPKSVFLLRRQRRRV